MKRDRHEQTCMARWTRPLARMVNGVALGMLLAATTANAAISYSYDELGRLVGMDDGGGHKVTYIYDPAGNMTTIGVNTSILRITSIAPSCASAGTAITIAGSGFGATPGGNTVKFNGLTGTVTQASTTRLIVTLPAGNTAGSIVVTTSAGSVTYGTPFGGSCAPPTITGFSPTSGLATSNAAPGTTVTITGTNFRTNPADNQVTFGLARAVVTAASASSLTTMVPEGAGSGSVSVVTPSGQATSTQDFFVIPETHAVTDVDANSTKRTAIGQPVTVTITAPSHVGMVLFTGTQGQRISVLGAPNTPWELQLVGPYGPIEARNPPMWQ
jgi:YD repeat-containing protein